MKLSPEVSAEDELVERARGQIRARMLATRRALPPAAVLARSQRIAAVLSRASRIASARDVALFWPVESQREVDLRALDTQLRREGKRLHYPFMDPRASGGFVTGFRRTDSPDELQRRGQPFREPTPGQRASQPGEIDVVVVPAVALTPEGARLGQGTGFYDVTLPDVRPPAVAVVVAFSFQLLMELPQRSHDVACDAVVTDEHLFDPQGLLRPR